MIPKQSSWPFHGILVALVTGIDQAPTAAQPLTVMKTVERCFRLGLKVASHYGVPGQAVLGAFMSAMQQDGGETCVKASQEFATSIGQAAIEDFKQSIGYQEKDQAAVKAITAKGGTA